MLSRHIPRWWYLPLSIGAIVAASCADGGGGIAGRVRAGLGNPAPADTPVVDLGKDGNLKGGVDGKGETPGPSASASASPAAANPTPTPVQQEAKSLQISADPASAGLTLDSLTSSPIVYVENGTPGKVQLMAAVELVTPSEATPSVKIWRSDKPTQAIVDSSGMVTAGTLATGVQSALIVISAEYGGKTATMSVVVARRGTLLPTIE